MEDGTFLCAVEGNTICLKFLSYWDFLNRRFIMSCVNLAPSMLLRRHEEPYLNSCSELGVCVVVKSEQCRLPKRGLLLMVDEDGFHWNLNSSSSFPG